MKKTYYLKLCMIFAMLFVTGFVFWETDTAKAATEGYWEYYVEQNNEVTITKYNGAESDVYIPEEINGAKVTAIEYDCFNNNTYMQTVTIPAAVKSIARNAFSNCTNLVIVNGMENVTSIASYAFNRCSSLEQIILGDKLTWIGDDCFHGCSSLTQCKLPDSLKTLGSNSFCNSGLTEIGVPASAEIGYEAFRECSNLETVRIGAYAKFSNGAFANCTSLKNLTIAEEGITNISAYAFSGCTGLEHVSIPSSIRSLGSDAFSGCTSLQKAELSYGLLTIGDSVFSGDAALNDINIPNSVLSIGWDAFSGCTSLRSILIPNSVTSIQNSVFYNDTIQLQYYPGSAAEKYAAEKGFTGEALTALPSESLKIGTADTELKTVEVEIGDVYRIPYVITPSDTTDAIVWESSSANIASVNGIGEVTANHIGTTTIIATSTSGKSSRIDVTVTDKPQSIELSASATTIRVGSTATLEATVYNTNYQIVTNYVPEFISSDPAVASVSAVGVVTGLKEGTVMITASVRDISVSQQITVVSNQPVSVSMSTSRMTLRAGGTNTRTATVRDGLGVRTDIKPVYTSSDPNVATVDSNGKVTAINAGTATITASIGNLTASYQVVVTGTSGGSNSSTQPTAVAFANKSAATILVGKTTTRKATVSGASGVLSNVTPAYVSSNPKIATVNSAGKVTGVKAGTVTITARAGNLSASYTVKVVMAKLSKSGKTLTVTTLPKAKVTVKANKSILGKSSKKATANNKGVAKIKFKKKIKGNVKVTITKSGYKKTSITKKF